MARDATAASKRRSSGRLSAAIRVLTVTAVVWFAASTVDADTVRVVGTAGVHAKPDLASDVLVVYQTGTMLDVSPRQGDWYPVLLPADSRGVRPYGYISAAVVEVVERSNAVPSRLKSDPRGAHNGLVLADVMIAEHVSERVSRIDIANNRAIGEEATRKAARRLQSKHYRLSDAVLTSSGLYVDGTAVLRLTRTTEPGIVGSRFVAEDTHWDLDDIMAATFLRRAGRPAERISPAALLGAPWPPALFLFPRRDANGEPLIADTSASLELHSTINGHEVVSNFDIARFGLRDVSELGVRRHDGAR
jgi:hypothetical protein